jgi:putative ABC transport system permease protein
MTFERVAGVQSVGAANSYPVPQYLALNLFIVQTDTGWINKTIECYSIDEHYFDVLGIKMAKGRNFSSPGDTLHSIVVNEETVKLFGWKEPIGKRVKFPGDTSGSYKEVVGVFHDFNQKSLYNPIGPLLLFYYPNGNVMQLKLDPTNIHSTVAKAETVWKKYFPQLPFEYKFLDEDFNFTICCGPKTG